MNYAVVDLGFGDCGKGTVVDYLSANESVSGVVRFNGGPQAGHNVVQPDGRHHMFSQFGSGTFHGVPTLLSHYMVVDPLRIRSEAEHLERMGVPNPLDLLFVDEKCLVVTPYHAIAQRLGEQQRGAQRHGSCGTGFGEAVKDREKLSALNVGQLFNRERLEGILAHQWGILSATFGRDVDAPPVDELVALYTSILPILNTVNGTGYLSQLQAIGDLVFEGAQGVLLDENYGFHPYTTWSTTTFANADDLICELADCFHLGVVRSYTTRHGPGPHVTAIKGSPFAGEHNEFNVHQGDFHVGHFDAVAHRYAARVCGRVDGLAVTHLDNNFFDSYCEAYESRSERLEWLEVFFSELPTAKEAYSRRLMRMKPVLTPWKSENRAEEIAEIMGIELMLESSGPTLAQKKNLLAVK